MNKILLIISLVSVSLSAKDVMHITSAPSLSPPSILEPVNTDPIVHKITKTIVDQIKKDIAGSSNSGLSNDKIENLIDSVSTKTNLELEKVLNEADKTISIPNTNDKSLLVNTEEKVSLTTKDKVSIMNNLKLELKNADESQKADLLVNLKKVSTEIFSQTEVSSGTMTLLNDISKNIELEQKRAINAQIISNSNTIQINNQITTQQAVSLNNQIQNIPPVIVPPVGRPLPIGD